MSKKKDIDMLHGPMFVKILLFALPLALSSILQLLFNSIHFELIRRIVVGQFAGSLALAAVGSNGALINLIVNAFMGLSVGANVIVARYHGSGNEGKVKNAVHTAITLSIVCGILLAFIGFFIAPQLLTLMSVPDDVIGLSALYIKIYFLGMPFMMLYNFGAAILRAIGDTKRPLVYLTISGIVNVLLNLVFVIVFHMSVAGVATATVISQVVSSLLVLKCLMNEQGSLRVDLKALKIDFSIFKEIARVGLPAGLQGCVFSLSNVVIQSTINSFGSVMVAGNSAAGNIEGFVYVVMNSFHQSAVTFSSQNYGAKQYDRCDKALIISAICGMSFGMLISLTFLYFKDILLGLYTTDPLVIEAGYIRMKILFVFQFANGLMDIMVGGLRGIGYSVMPTIISLTGACILRLVYISTIFPLNPTIENLYIIYPITWTITTIAHIIVYLIGRKKIRMKLKSV